MQSLNTVYARIRSAAVKSVILLLCVLTSWSTFGGWVDPLKTPATPTLKAPFDLLLDITQAGNRLVAVGGRGHIIYSDDDGFSWVQANVPVIATLTSVYFPDAQNGWAVGHDAVILVTKDGGATWEKQFDGFAANKMLFEQAAKQKDLAQEALNQAKLEDIPEKIQLAEELLETKTFAMEDAQYDYEDGSTKPLLDVWFKNASEGFVVGAYGMIFKTDDGGQSWSDWSSNVENPDRFHLNAISYAGGERLMIVGELGLILRSEDGGQSWAKTFSPYEGTFFGVVSINNHQVQLAFGLRGNLARSDSFGNSWLLEDTGTEQSLIGGLANGNGTAYLVGNGGVLAEGLDLGQTWQASTRTGRSAATAIIETQAGHFVLVGEQGVELVNKSGERISNMVKSMKVEG